ncbi:MAG: serine hydroxymethyltransferase, partial [Patulibacter sp.]
FDPRPPMVTSGLRIGTPALATRGLTVDSFKDVGQIIGRSLATDATTFAAERDDLATRVRAIADQYPLYAELG